MEDYHRKAILRNIDKLVECTKYEKLLHACEQTGLLSPIMKQIIDNSPDDIEIREKHKKLFTKITKRGPDAYNKLESILVSLKFDEAAQIIKKNKFKDSDFKSLNGTQINREVSRMQLSGDRDINIEVNRNIIPPITSYEGSNHSRYIGSCLTRKDSETPALEPYKGEINSAKFKRIRKSNRIHIDPKIQTYPMRSRNRGVLFMVNIIQFLHVKPRDGAEIDGQCLLHLFKELGFHLFAYENLTSKQFHTLLDELLDSDYTRKSECFVMVLMTHGKMINDSVDIVEFTDGSIEKVGNILDKFKNDTCMNLVGKPKIFIFPFCRGERSDKELYTKVVETDGIGNRMPRSNPTYSDMLICYATVPGFMTLRDPDAGAWYIQKFYEVFAEYAHDTYIEDMLKMIGDRAGKIRTNDGRLQTASSYNYGFFKKLYFNPGCYED